MKFRKLAVTLTAAALVSTLSSSFALAANQENNSKQSLVSLGDSITLGYNLGNNHHPSKEAYPYIIGDQEGWRVRDLAGSGDTSTDLLNKLKDAKFREAIRHADVITMDIGSNDFLQGAKSVVGKMITDPNYEPTKEDIDLITGITTKFIVNLNEIIKEVRSLSDAPVVLYNLYNPFYGMDDQAGMLLSGANYIISSFGRDSRNNIKVVNAFEVFAGRQNVLIRPNDVHPNEAGQEVLAQLAIDALTQ